MVDAVVRPVLMEEYHRIVIKIENLITVSKEYHHNNNFLSFHKISLLSLLINKFAMSANLLSRCNI